MKPRYVTKSRFALAHQCPTKLFYTGKKEYADQSNDDPFMKALAEGGFQVGELAKLYYPGGIEVETMDYDEAVEKTSALLDKENVIIFEAAIRFEDFFIRADIVKKTGARIELIEVKSKSFDPSEDSFQGKKGGITAKWDKYLHDVAFQTFVFRNAFPQFSISPFLFLADKSSQCSVDGLNQKFILSETKPGRVEAIAKHQEITEEDVAVPIMILKDVSSIVGEIISPPEFSKTVREWAKAYKEDNKISPRLSRACKDCQFYKEPSDEVSNLRSGKSECWSETLKVSTIELKEPSVLELWNCRVTDKLFEQEKYFLKDLAKEDFNIKARDRSGLSQSERQWLQVEKVQNKDSSIYCDYEALEIEKNQWLFPLHFIDFETTRVAIPFYKGHRPYEGVAFQYSHHIIEESGRISHAGEYLHQNPGEFPNFHFIRALKRELDKDHGTIFRYATHENTFLNVILSQLERSKESDRLELISFIESMTSPTKDSVRKWEPNREMVDLCELVKLYYYDPTTHGSNSIKDVLPAVLRSSKYLQEKYSKPVYGSAIGISSKNFKDHSWIQFDSKGGTLDPYKTLPSILSDQDPRSCEFIFKADRVNDGGAAMTAWARMQFTEMSDQERSALAKALLKYCELDTFAMVMLYEHWVDLLQSHSKGIGISKSKAVRK